MLNYQISAKKKLRNLTSLLVRLIKPLLVHAETMVQVCIDLPMEKLTIVKESKDTAAQVGC